MKTRFAALALAGAIALPMFAAAQQGPGPGPRPEPREAMHARMCEDMDARLAARLAWLEAKVKPTDAQRGAWDTFLRDSRAAAAPMRAQCAPGQAMPPRGDLVAELGMREQRMAAMLDATRQTKAAVEKLMPQLAEDQRKALADNFHGGRGGRAMHDRHHQNHRGPGMDGMQHGQAPRQGG